MVLACWSVQGGVGTTVVVGALAVAVVSRGDEPLVVDLGGDVSALFGVDDPPWPGLAGWLGAGPDVPDDALVRLEGAVAPGLSVLPRGHGALVPGRVEELAAALRADPRPVLIDAGVVVPGSTGALLTARADRSILVTRACPLALRRLASLPLPPDGVVVVRDPRRAVTWPEVEAACGAPVLATVDIDPAVAAAVDAGFTRRSLPRQFLRVIGGLA